MRTQVANTEERTHFKVYEFPVQKYSLQLAQNLVFDMKKLDLKSKGNAAFATNLINFIDN